DYDTVAKRKRDLGTALENLYRFLNLVGFISLLLGAVGVASAIPAHLQQKTKTGAILRCLGLSAAGMVSIYLLQTAAMGLFGAGLFFAVGIFAGVAKLLIVGIRKFFPHGWSFVLRQGLANLYRPNNRTLLLTLSLGLGTFLLLNLYLTREVLLAQFTSVGAN